MQVQAGQAGVDEAGCGALMGELVAAAVVLPPSFDLTNVRDSKRLTPAARARVYERILQEASVGVGTIRVDELNARPFAWARREVFKRALEALASPPDHIVVDGTTDFFSGFCDIPYECVPKADATHAAVAAASIVAKVTRDRMVQEVCDAEPDVEAQYGWARNKGYPSQQHLMGLRIHGVTRHHRIQFRPCQAAAHPASA